MIPGIGMIGHVGHVGEDINLTTGLTNAFNFEGDCNDYVGGTYESYSAPAYNNVAGIHNYYANFYSDTGVYATFSSLTGAFNSYNMSLSVWVRNNGNSPFIYNTQSSGYGFFINLSSNLITVYANTSGGLKSVSGTIVDSQWCHIVVTMKTNGYLCLYINGTLAGSVAIATRILGTTAAIKQDTGGGSGSGSFWIDEWYLWNLELAQAAVTALYNAGSGRFHPTF
jgi:hypothetical protein